MSHEPLRRNLSIRLTDRMAAELRQAADREAGAESAIARRLIKIGLAQELHVKAQTPEREG